MAVLPWLIALGVLLGLLVWMAHREDVLLREHARERDRWAEERRALLVQCAPGLQIGTPEPARVVQRSDADEWRIERERLRDLGMIDGDPHDAAEDEDE